MAKSKHASTFKAHRQTGQQHAYGIAAICQHYFDQHPWRKRLLVTLGFVVLWLLASYLFYLRFPNNYREPNFFGEEGYIWSKNLIEHGFFQAIGTTFNGYYIWFLYLLEKLALIINGLFGGSEFANLPRIFALISYGFLGFMAILPLLLLRRIVKLPALLLTSLFVIYVPLGWWDYGVIGALGNIKFELMFVSLILLIYRHYLPAGSWKFYAVDASLLICAYTNITVYALLPFALLRYWPQLRVGKPRTLGFKPVIRRLARNAKNLVLHDHSIQSLIVLAIALLPQLYIIKTQGIPPIPGYLTNAYNHSRTIEIFVARSYLYQFFFPIYKLLNNFWTLVIFGGLLGLSWRYARKYRLIIAFSLLTVFGITLLFVTKRTGISDFFLGYTDAGPAQFFFTQNWIFGFVVSILLVELISRAKPLAARLGLYGVIVAAFLLFMMPQTGSFGANDFEAKQVGNIYKVSQKACSQQNSADQDLQIPIYPATSLQYTGLSRQQLCTPSVIDYQEPEVPLGLHPFNNTYLPADTTRRFTQTFTAGSNNLSGLTIYFSTFAQTVRSPYDLILLDAACKQTIHTSRINTRKIADNSLFTIRFPKINDSKGKTYCFTITAPQPPKEPLAIQLSQPDAYPGVTMVGDKPSTQDVVFQLHYK